MTDPKNETGWFRHKDSGQVFEAEGQYLKEARKNSDLEETVSPEAAIRMELDKREIKYAPNSGIKKLRELLAEGIAKAEAKAEADAAKK